MNCSFDEPISGRPGFPDGQQFFEPIWAETVDPSEADLEALATEILAQYRPDEAGIHTSPSSDAESLVGIDTWFWLDDAVYAPVSVTIPASPVPGLSMAVTINAMPTEDRPVLWNTGEETIECTNTAPREQCAAQYERSSLEQPHEYDGLPAYEITASYAYVGNYSVSINGIPIVAGDLAEIQRTSVAYLPVSEAQALNTSEDD